MTLLSLDKYIPEIEKLSNFEPEDFFIAAQYGFKIVATLFIARTIVTYTGRKFGFNHPIHYSKWPRLPWRTGVRVYLSIKRWYEQVFIDGKRATGGFASTLSNLTLLYHKGHFLIGRLYIAGFGCLQPLGAKLQRHALFIAATGAGKTASLIAMIACWGGCVFVIDPKGSIWFALAGRDKRQWILFAPYDTDSECWNCFDDIKAAIEQDGPSAGVLWANRSAICLILTPEGARNPFFTEASRNLVSGLVLHIISSEPEENHNLVYLYQLLQQGYRVFNPETGEEETTAQEAYALLFRIMRNSEAFNLAVSGAAATMASASTETAGNVLSTALEQLKWLSLPDVQRVVKETTIPPLSDLKTRNDLVLSFCAPVYSIRQELSPLARLLTSFVGYTFESHKGRKNGQTLAVIDEFPSLGYMESIEVMAPVARSYGLNLALVTQDIEVLKKTYPKTWEGYIGNADFVFYMATNHETTASYLERVLNKKTHFIKDRNTGSKTRLDLPVMTSDQIKRFLDPASGNMIVTRNGKRPLKAKIPTYFTELPVKAYAADPDHKEALLRRIWRFLFCRNQSHTAPKTKPRRKI